MSRPLNIHKNLIEDKTWKERIEDEKKFVVLRQQMQKRDKELAKKLNRSVDKQTESADKELGEKKISKKNKELPKWQTTPPGPHWPTKKKYPTTSKRLNWCLFHLIWVEHLSDKYKFNDKTFLKP